MIYLASPYTDADPAVRQWRYDAACRVTAMLLRVGQVVFSPVVHGHPLVKHGLGTDWQAWERLDRALLERCDEVVVLKLEGWERSLDVAAEIRMAQAFGKPVHFVEPVALGGAQTPTPARQRFTGQAATHAVTGQPFPKPPPGVREAVR